MTHFDTDMIDITPDMPIGSLAGRTITGELGDTPVTIYVSSSGGHWTTLRAESAILGDDRCTVDVMSSATLYGDALAALRVGMWA